MTATPKIAREVAEAEFERMCAARRIDTNTSTMSEAQLATWTELREDILRDLQSGDLIVGADALPTYQPPVAGVRAFTFHPSLGKTWITMGAHVVNHMEGMVVAMAHMARCDRIEFEKLETPDFFACNRIGQLFLLRR
jgi:hypothetical protein